MMKMMTRGDNCSWNLIKIYDFDVSNLRILYNQDKANISPQTTLSMRVMIRHNNSSNMNGNHNNYHQWPNICSCLRHRSFFGRTTCPKMFGFTRYWSALQWHHLYTIHNNLYYLQHWFSDCLVHQIEVIIIPLRWVNYSGCDSVC